MKVQKYSIYLFNVFIDTFDQFNASLVNTIINFL